MTGQAARKNLIILTAGLTGSSVLAGLLARAGYWVGDETYRKSDYDTFENLELVRLNKELMRRVGCGNNYEMVFSAGDIPPFVAASEELDGDRYKGFLARCEEHAPWLWKDPRLRLTIHFWARYLDLDQTQFILLSRSPSQAWISSTLRRQIQTPRYCRELLQDICQSLRDFLARYDQPCLELVYEDLLTQPEESISRINDFLGTGLALSDLEHTYHGDLGRHQHGLKNLSKALLIYAKNYPQRFR